MDQLKEIKIGKLVNLVRGEERFDKEIRKVAFSLVNRWKEMVQVYKNNLQLPTPIPTSQNSFN